MPDTERSEATSDDPMLARLKAKLWRTDDPEGRDLCHYVLRIIADLRTELRERADEPFDKGYRAGKHDADIERGREQRGATCPDCGGKNRQIHYACNECGMSGYGTEATGEASRRPPRGYVVGSKPARDVGPPDQTRRPSTPPTWEGFGGCEKVTPEHCQHLRLACPGCVDELREQVERLTTERNTLRDELANLKGWINHGN